MGCRRQLGPRVRPGGIGVPKRGEVSKTGKRTIMMMASHINSEPDTTVHFGPYGGRFVPEVLMAPLEELEQAYRAASSDPVFQAELTDLLTHYAGRATPLYYARRLSET